MESSRRPSQETGNEGFTGDGGLATSAELWNPDAVVVDASGNLIIADYTNNRIRKRLSASGITITTIAGSGSYGFSGDGGLATASSLNNPSDVAVDASGNLFIADSYNNRVRVVLPGGTITTVAGNGELGFSGDGGPATSAELSGPEGVALDASGNLFIADSGNGRIRKVALAASPSFSVFTVSPANLSFSLFGGSSSTQQISLTSPEATLAADPPQHPQTGSLLRRALELGRARSPSL